MPDRHAKRPKHKKPLSSLNQIFLMEMRRVPEIFLRYLIKDKLKAQKVRATKKLVDALIERVINAEDFEDEFEWEGNDAGLPDIRIEFTPKDIEALENQVRRFWKEEVPPLLIQTVNSSAKIILDALREDWPAQKAYDAERLGQFRANLEGRWGDAFDILRMMYVIACEIGQEASKRRARLRKESRKQTLDTLLRLQARACQVAAEIITLMENGFADGAMARWRTLHEIAVVALLIREFGDDLTQRYLDHEFIEAKRAMDRFVQHHESMGCAPPSAREIARVEADYQSMLGQYGHGFGSDYGWAAHHLKLKKPRFNDLEAASGKIGRQSHYKMASYNVHASPRGIAVRLGLIGDGIGPSALAGPSNTGFVEPAVESAHDLALVTTLLFKEDWSFDHMIEAKMLLMLRNELAPLVGTAQQQLHKDHRSLMKSKFDRVGGTVRKFRRARASRI